MRPESSSLDRFLRNRAPAFLGLAGARTSVFMNGALGIALCAMGLGMVVGSIVTGEPGMGVASVGPLFGGGVNLWVSSVMRRRTAQLRPPGVELTEESRIFMHRLMRQAFGWRYAWVGWDQHGWGHRGFLGRKRRLIRSLLAATSDDSAQRPSAQCLSPDVFAVLEAATQHYNRIQGVIASLPHGVSGSLSKLRPAILQAADETIADVLHQAALLEKFPESDSAARRIAGQRIEALREAADRVEALQQSEPSILARLAPTSTMEAVLEDLRIDQSARNELTETESQGSNVSQAM